jgi:hypothetical protein
MLSCLPGIWAQRADTFNMIRTASSNILSPTSRPANCFLKHMVSLEAQTIPALPTLDGYKALLGIHNQLRKIQATKGRDREKALRWILWSSTTGKPRLFQTKAPFPLQQRHQLDAIYLRRTLVIPSICLKLARGRHRCKLADWLARRRLDSSESGSFVCGLQ